VRTNLVAVLQRQGRLQDAEQLLASIVDSHHETAGRDAPSTTKVRCQLAFVQAKLGDPAKFREAEFNFREVLKQREETLGIGHPDTLVALGHVAFILEEKRPEEAEQLREQLWLRMDTAVPAERRRTRSRQSAFVQSLQDEPDRAEAMLRQVVERRRTALGTSHPDVLASHSELAALLSRSGSPEGFAEALTIQREVAELNEKTRGPYHVDTLSARSALAGTLARRGAAGAGSGAVHATSSEAETMHLETMKRFPAALVTDRPNTNGKEGKCAVLEHK